MIKNNFIDNIFDVGIGAVADTFKEAKSLIVGAGKDKGVGTQGHHVEVGDTIKYDRYMIL